MDEKPHATGRRCAADFERDANDFNKRVRVWQKMRLIEIWRERQSFGKHVLPCWQAFLTVLGLKP